MINNIRHLRYIVAVANAASLQEAAQEQRISESALSTAIKTVEAELGYSVFVRRPSRALSLSHAGAEFIVEATALLEQFDAFTLRTIGLGETLRGTVRLGAVSAFSSIVLPPVLRRLQGKHPDLKVQIFEFGVTEIIERLREGDIDVAITYDFLTEADVEMTSVVSVTPHIGVSDQTEYRFGDTVSLADFNDRPLILLDEPGTRQHVLGMFRKLGQTPKVEMNPKSVRLMTALVSENFGYGIYFLQTIRRGFATRENQVQRLHIAEPIAPCNVVVARSRRQMQTARVTAVHQMCEEVLTELSEKISF